MAVLEEALDAAGLGEDFSGHSGRIGMARRMVAAGGAQRRGAAPRPVEARGHGRPLHPGRGTEMADMTDDAPAHCKHPIRHELGACRDISVNLNASRHTAPILGILSK